MVHRLPFNARPGLRFLSVATLCFVVLFLSMDLRIGPYDEGFVLTAAMREMAGQIPHRDFYFAYGPGQSYLLAGLFRLFGPSVLIARLLDLVLKSVLVASADWMLCRMGNRFVAGTVSLLLLVFLFGLPMPGSVGIPVAILMIWATWLILPAFHQTLPAHRAFGAGTLAGLAALFRYDMGVAVAALELLLLLLAAALAAAPVKSRLRAAVHSTLPFAAGVLVLPLPVVLAYLAVAPFSDFYFDIVSYPSHFYVSGRSLPFPRIHLKTLDDLAIYLPVAVILLALATVFTEFRAAAVRRRPIPPGVARAPLPFTPSWLGFLAAFSLLATVMYLKGLVRASSVQMFSSMLPALLLLGVLWQHRAQLPSISRAALGVCGALVSIAACWSALHHIKDVRVTHTSVLEVLTHGSGEVATHPEWRLARNPLTRGLTFFPGPDHEQAIAFLAAHTAPADPLYVGLLHHDRIFVNDNLTYFATQRLPATKWSQFDPGLQNQAVIQRQIISSLNAHPPPYIAVDAEFDQVREPNASAVSSGVFLLDRFLADHYRLVRSWGEISVWQRSSSARRIGSPDPLY